MTDNGENMGVTVKPLVWPDFIAPQQYEDAAPGWEGPRLPDFRQIFNVARECGYSIGLHGSMRRDCDMIAAPWTDEASTADHLIDRLCSALNAMIVCASEDKPHGRRAWNLQIDGYFKVIDISVMPPRAPVTVQDAVKVPEIAALINAADLALNAFCVLEDSAQIAAHDALMGALRTIAEAQQ